MKIAYSKITKIALIFLIVINVSLTKVFADILPALAQPNFTWGLTAASSTILGIGYLLRFWKGMPNYIKILIAYIFFMLFIEVILTRAFYDYPINSGIASILRFFPCFLIFPIYYYLQQDKNNLNSLIKIIIICTILSYLLRMFISIFDINTNITLFKDIVYEYREAYNSYRSGFLRINPPSFGIIFTVLCMWMYFQSTRVSQKVFYFLCVAISVFYSYYIHASRAAFLYVLIIIIWMIAKKSRTAKKQLLLILFVFFLALVISTSSIGDFFENFIGSFSTTSDEAYSTLARINALSYYWNEFEKNMLLGIGAFEENDMLVPDGYGHISDLGIVANVFRFGLLGLIMLVLLFGRLLYNCYRCRHDNEFFLLSSSIFISYSLFGMNFDCFYQMFAFSVPFSLSISEYIADQNRKACGE